MFCYWGFELYCLNSAWVSLWQAVNLQVDQADTAETWFGVLLSKIYSIPYSMASTAQLLKHNLSEVTFESTQCSASSPHSGWSECQYFQAFRNFCNFRPAHRSTAALFCHALGYVKLHIWPKASWHSFQISGAPSLCNSLFSSILIHKF